VQIKHPFPIGHQEPLHDSAISHVQGTTVYIDDITPSEGELQAWLVTSPVAKGKIKRLDISAAEKIKGVACILTAKDIPGDNQMGPVFHDEPCMAEKKVDFIGQTLAIIAAVDFETAYRAAKAVKLYITPEKPVLTIEDSIKKGLRLHPARKIERGNTEATLKKCRHTLKGRFKSGAQEHWYLETQICLAVPGEEDEMTCYSSTQHPSETQAIVAEVLGVPRNQVVVETRRLGGAFGGKETSGNHIAAWASLLAYKTRKPVRLRLTRDMDQAITGKRHRFLSDWEIGFDEKGQIQAYDVNFNADAGYASDLTMAILERTMFHAENAYYIPHIRIIGNTWKTNLPSNVAFRGFGQPQGMAVIENAIDAIARFLKKDPAEIRRINFYGIKDRNTAPYGKIIDQNRLPLLYKKIIASSEYHSRKRKIDEFNRQSQFVKKGIALTPVKFGISFTTSFLNQAGSLIHIYSDGSIQVNHGGIEMGQGLNTKMLQVAAAELGVKPERIKVTPTNTSKIPNTSATAASSGSDLNGMAIKHAVEQLKERIRKIAPDILSELFPRKKFNENSIVIENDFVFDKSLLRYKCGFSEFVLKAYLKQVHLSAAGFYKTPGIWFDREKGTGNPFHYFTYGMAVSEVEVNTLTGRVHLLRADLIEDAGISINTMIDKGQIIGGFVQGLGWVTCEDIKWNDQGKILNASPDTYKIPTISDIPARIFVELLKDAPNHNTIRQSKAVGEPPFPMAISVWLAIKYAVSAVFNHKYDVPLSIPATNEEIVMCIREMTIFPDRQQ
jgi:xanthine dehydrogenase molybdopterin binding subunit